MSMGEGAIFGCPRKSSCTELPTGGAFSLSAEDAESCVAVSSKLACAPTIDGFGRVRDDGADGKSLETICEW
jgi:hypothetical protein